MFDYLGFLDRSFPVSSIRLGVSSTYSSELGLICCSPIFRLRFAYRDGWKASREKRGDPRCKPPDTNQCNFVVVRVYKQPIEAAAAHNTRGLKMFNQSEFLALCTWTNVLKINSNEFVLQLPWSSRCFQLSSLGQSHCSTYWHSLSAPQFYWLDSVLMFQVPMLQRDWIIKRSRLWRCDHLRYASHFIFWLIYSSMTLMRNRGNNKETHSTLLIPICRSSLMTADDFSHSFSLRDSITELCTV